MRTILLACTASLALTGAAMAAAGDTVRADLQGDGISGSVEMRETASGAIHVHLRAEGVPEGAHGFHVHETGACDAADGFKSAGGHLAHDLKHGVTVEGGPHPGDFPNVHAQSDGVINVEFFTYGFALSDDAAPSVLDDDGSAVVLHAGADDYNSQPSGDSGDRIACGVLKSGS